MKPERLAYLSDLLESAERFDRAQPDRRRRYRNITPETGEFLSLLVHALAARRVLEVGTSNGYSTIWLADALIRNNGQLVTIENDSGRAAEATVNLARAGVADRVQLLRGDAQDELANLVGKPFDLVFLDAERSEYIGFWPALARLIRRDRGLLVVDNAVSHARELAEFCEMLERDPRFVTSLVPVGKGEFLALSTE